MAAAPAAAASSAAAAAATAAAAPAPGPAPGPEGPEAAAEAAADEAAAAVAASAAEQPEAFKVSLATLFRFCWDSVADSFRRNRYRLPARFYIILCTSMWASLVGWMVMAYLGALDEIEARHKGPGPLCGAVPTGPFYQALIPKLIMAFMFLVTLSLFFFPALLRP